MAVAGRAGSERKNCSEKQVAAGEAAAAGAAGRPSCCGWRKAMAGLSGEVTERQVGRLAQ